MHLPCQDVFGSSSPPPTGAPSQLVLRVPQPAYINEECVQYLIFCLQLNFSFIVCSLSANMLIIRSISLQVNLLKKSTVKINSIFELISGPNDFTIRPPKFSTVIQPMTNP